MAASHRATVLSRPQTRFALGLVLALVLLVPAVLLLTMLYAFAAPWPMLALMGVMAALVSAYFADSLSRLTVGDDGVTVRRRFRDRFLPFGEIVDVVELNGVVLRFILRTGESVDVYTGKDEPVAKPEYVEVCDKLFGEIQHRLRRYRERSEAPLLGEAAVRDLAYQMLRGAEQPAKTPYRTVPAPKRDELWKVVEAGTSDRSRAAAAALLCRQDGEGARPKLRVAASSTASPRLRKFFRVAADNPDVEALREALEELEAEGELRARKPERGDR